MQTKVAIATGIGGAYLVTDILMNGLTTKHGITTGYINATTQAWNIPTHLVEKGSMDQTIGCIILIIAAFIYVAGLIGPVPRKEHVDGMPVDAAMHESIFGMNYEE